MVKRLPGWTPHVERLLKEVLYRFLEEVHCTKAALYLRTPSPGFELAVRYGFGRGDAPPATLEPDAPLAVAAGDPAEQPLAVNRIEEAPPLADLFRSAGIHRLLLVPLRAGGRLIGLVDAREKGGQQPFTDGDRAIAAEIADALAALVTEIGLVRAVEPDLVAADGDWEMPVASGDRRQQAPLLLDEPGLAGVVSAAADAVVGDRLFAIAITVADGAAASTLVLGAVDADGGESAALRTHQARALQGVTGSVPRRSDWPVEWRRVGGADSALQPARVVSDVVLHEGGWAVVVSVIWSEESCCDPLRVVDRLRRTVAAAHDLSSLRYARRALARRLLQPGERGYPELLGHSVAVSRLCWDMAHAAGLGHELAELAAVAGLLHDVGMRELDYDRLYRLVRPGPEHRRAYRRHVLAGERIVRGVGLDAVADAIRHHHERWDGTGYPDRLGGDEIPTLSRMVHVAEVFDVLTSPASYLAPIAQDQALGTITEAGGTQFDREMVHLLARVVA